MRHFFSLCFLCIAVQAFHLSAQPYSCFYNGRTANYAVSMGYWSGNFSFVEVDSFKANGSDTTFFFTPAVRSDMAFEALEFCLRPSVLGNTMVKKNNGIHIFVNTRGDSIYIPAAAQVDDTNFLVRADSGAYYSTYLDTIGTYSVFGVLDTVKYFRIVSFDSSGNPINRHYKWDHIILSKTYGIVLGFDFHWFPNQIPGEGYPDNIPLAGQMNPDMGVTNLTALEIFDYEVGDEFHYKSGWSGSYSQPNHYIRRIVQDKITFGADSIRYLLWVNHIYIASASYPSPATFNDTTMEELVVSRTSHPELDKLPSGFSGYKVIIMDDTNVKTVQSGGSADSCGYFPFEGCYGGFAHYERGLGLRTFENIGVNPHCAWDYKDELQYYSKGTAEWGVPIDFAHLALLAHVESAFAPDELQLITHERNAELRFHFSVSRNVSIHLYGALGQLIYQQTSTQQSGSLLIELPSAEGIYLLEVWEGMRRKSFKLMKG